jgi:two-component system LytT family response regulator
MIQAVIVDDEQPSIDRLSGLLTTHCSHLVHLAGTVTEGAKLINNLQPELVFLDVQLGDETGFDLLKRLPEIQFGVVFTTAFDKYAVQAFRFSAIDYLLKPIDPADLMEAITKMKERHSAQDTARRLDVLFHNLKPLEGTAKKISVPTLNGFVFVEVSKIIRCESDVNYTNIFLTDKRKLTVAKTLKEFEELLSDYNFYRVHNSHLINLAYMTGYHKGKGGYVTMADNSEIEVSSRRKSDFLKRITSL